MGQLQRGYALFTLKSFDDDRRVLSGIATSPSVDRMGDIVDPLGAKFATSIPLLLFHDSRMPVGTAKLGKPTRDGVTFEASIPDILEAGTLRDRVQEAWQSIKAGLIRGVSIGFRAAEDGVERLKNGGLKFTDFEILELSLVAIPANQDASILSIKSLCTHEPVASDAAPRAALSSAGVTAPLRSVKAVSRESVMKNPIADQIKNFENTRAAKVAERDAIMDAATEKGETLNQDETDKYDALDVEIKSVDEHLKRLRLREEDLKTTAVAVTAPTAKAASDARGGVAQIRVESRMPDGLEFAAAVLCKASAFLSIQKGEFISAVDIAKQRYPDYLGIQKYLTGMRTKTAVAGGTTSDSNFATALLEPNQVLVNSFLEYLRPRTLIGQLPTLQRVPFNVTFQSQTSAASASWVGQGKAKPLTKFNTTTTTLSFTKIAAIAVITEELARFSRPGAETFVRDELAKSVIERMDLDFIDPAKAVSSGVNPASITNGVSLGNTAGTSAANVLTDIQALVAPFIAAKYPVSQLVILMPDSLAFAASLMLNASGFRSFPDISINGGSIGGIPVVTSQYMANTSSYGNIVAVIHPPSIALADDGNVSVDASREASLEMSDAPSGDATNGTGASMVSMFQTNSIALRAEREINWKKLRSDAVTAMDDVNWGSVGSPV